jgi:DNA polymerase-3 subunit gamma/tau
MGPSTPDAAATVTTGPGGGYQVVARRYRPQHFRDLVGQEHVARGLAGAIESGRIGHAYLFTGARGVGKTSAARIYAKALECGRREAGEPCGECQSCRAIAAGQDVDVVEIDAASNRGIDEMRQLRQNVAVRPARGLYKIYIIDEVHMLTREAFNALLKTLEEPPAHVKFVLCTTEPDKLPITILSRCQRFDFQTVDVAAIARRLAQIVEAEGADVSPEALSLIARRAAGSMRDSQSLLEQLLGSAAGPIGVDEVHAVIGTGREERVGAIVAAIAARDARAALAAFDAAVGGGADPGGVLEQVLAALRDSLVASVGCGPDSFLAGAGLGVDLAEIGRQTGTVTLLAMLQVLDQALVRMRSSGHAAVLAEMALVRLACLDDLDSLAEAVERVTAAAPLTAAGAAASRAPAVTASVAALASPAAPAASAPAIAPTTPPAPAPREKKTTDLTPAVVAAAEDAVAAAADGAAPAEDGGGSRAAMAPEVEREPREEEPLVAWQAAAEAVGGLVADFAAMACRAAWRDGVLEIGLPHAAAQAASFLGRPEVAANVARSLSEARGRPVRPVIVVDPPSASPAAQVSADVERPRAAASQAALVRDALDHPLVAQARATFDAAIRKVEPPRPRPTVAPVAAGGSGRAEADDGPDAAGDAGGAFAASSAGDGADDADG